MQTINIVSQKDVERVCNENHKPNFDYLIKEINNLRLEVADLKNMVEAIVRRTE